MSTTLSAPDSKSAAHKPSSAFSDLSATDVALMTAFPTVMPGPVRSFFWGSNRQQVVLEDGRVFGRRFQLRHGWQPWELWVDVDINATAPIVRGRR